MTGLNGFATSGTQLIYLRVLLAVSEAFCMPCALALISEHHPEKTRSKAIAIHLSSMAVGQVTGGFLGGFMGQYFHWRTLFFLLGGAGVLYAPLLVLALHGAPGPAGHVKAAERQSFWQAGRSVVNVKTLQFVGIAFDGYSIVGSVMQTWLPYFLFEKFHASLTTAGFSAAFYRQFPTALGNIAWGAAGDFFAMRSFRGRMLVQAGSLMVSAPLFLSMGLAGSIVGVAASLILLGFLRTGWPPNVMPVIFQVVPAHLSSTTYGLLNFAGNISAALALLVASDLGRRFGLAELLPACA